MSGHSEALVARVLALAEGATGASGLTVILAEPGRVHLAIDRRDDLVQFKGYFHGGVISGLADLAGGGAITTALPPGRAVITISLHVNFLAPARGERLVAKGTLVKAGSTIGVTSIEVVTIDKGREQVCATASVTYRVVGADSGSGNRS